MFTKHQLPDIEIREKKAAMHAAWMTAVDTENALDDGATDPDVENARAAAKAAKAVYEEFEAPEVMQDYDGNHIRCSACGAPVYDDDEHVTDPITDEVFLRIAIGLPPREKKDEGQLLPDAEVA